MQDYGYSIVENVFTDSEIDRLITNLISTNLKTGRAGARHLMSSPIVYALAKDIRMLNIAQQILGDSAIPYRATLFDKSIHSNWLVVWHQDTALPLVSQFDDQEWDPWSSKNGIKYAHAPTWALEHIVALRVHLDASTTENGPLKIIKGSHKFGVLTDEQLFNIAHNEIATECLVGRGGVLTMRPLIIHYSSKVKTASSRRVVHIEYTDTMRLRDNIMLAIA